MIEQGLSVNICRLGGNFMGEFGRSGARFLFALGKDANGANEYPNVRCGLDFNNNGGSAEKFSVVSKKIE